MFTLQNFEKQLNKVMLQRGKQYHEEGTVADLEENTGRWTAEVEGTETYNISVTLKNDKEIVAYNCDCPYDGAICKHVIAVLFEIKDELAARVIVPKKGAKKNQFEDLLLKISADEYRGFIKEYALNNKDFKMAFELFFADKDGRIDTGKLYTDLIKKLIKKQTARGYLDYRSAVGLAKEVNQLVDKGFDFANKRNFVEAFVIAGVVLKEMMQVITYCDDSSGALGDVICNTINLIDVIALSDDAVIDMKTRVFNFLQTELNDGIYFDYGDFGYELSEVFQTLAVELNLHHEFLGWIDAWLPRLTAQHSNYRLEHFKTTKIDFLKAIGRHDEAEALIELNMEIVEVRQAEVDKVINNKDYEHAKKLINDGIKIAEDKRHPGTVSQWEKQLLRIALLENDVALTRKYYREFAFDRQFDGTYYRALKATYDAVEWESIVEDIITDIKTETTKKHGKSTWHPFDSYLLSALSPIYIEERFTDRLFELVKNEKDIDRLMIYHEHLVFAYASELLQLYIPALERQGDNAGNRSHYAQVAGNMKKIMKALPFGKEQVIDLAKKLKQKYSRRPAMIEELNAVIY
jgi:hypothetical protein